MKKINSIIILALISTLLVTGCGYIPTPANNDDDQSWIDDHEDDSEDYNDDEENQDDWNDEFSDEDDDAWDEEEEQEQEQEDASLDTWKFANESMDTKVDVKGYYISLEDYNRLISNISDTELKYLLHSYEKNSSGESIQKDNYNIDNNSTNYVLWGGSCYGMAISTSLVNRNIISANSLNAENTLETSDLTKDDFSAINFYFWQQKLAPCRASLDKFMQYDSRKQVSWLARTAISENPFVINFYWQDSLSEGAPVYGHAVVGYGIESGEWSCSKGSYSHTYNTKVSVYDCNAPEDETGTYAFYLDTEDGSWCYPAYNVMSTSNDVTDATQDNGKLGCVIASDDYLNAVDYSSGVLSNAYIEKLKEEATATIQFGAGQTYSIQSSSGSANVNGLVVTNSSYGNLIHTAATVCGRSNSIETFIPQNESFYNIDSDENLDFALDVGNMLISVQTDCSGAFEFNADGSMELKCDKKPSVCNIEITSDNSNAFGIENCNTIELMDAESKDLKIKQTLSGIEINGDDLSNLKVNGEMYGKETSIKASTDENSVLLNLKNNNIVAETDTNSDGNYDTVISKTALPKDDVKIILKNRTVTYTGKNQKVKTAKIVGTDSKNVIYVYYKDKKCKHETASHKNVGTYYVKALKLNECGTFYESNVAKLIIKKGNQRITQKTKSISFKESDLKKKKKTGQIKATSAGKLTFKKTSGNSKIAISNTGKITVKKGLAKGTYKLKVKASAKATNNYKKTSKILTLTIKIK